MITESAEKKTYEVYELRLSHYISDRGDRHMLDVPLVVTMTFERANNAPLPVCLNEMIDKMRAEMLKRTE